MAKAQFNFEVPAHLKDAFLFQTAGTFPPNGIIFGFNTVKQVGVHAKKLGGKKTLLVTDKVMVQLGFADLVKASLEKEGLKADIFDQVEPEPHFETADILYEIVRRTDFDLVVGLGGGSCMDMAKLIAVAATNQQTPKEVMEKRVVTKAALKKILIPTTAGTGSQVSRTIVISGGRDKYSFGTPFARAEIALIDPGLTISMPPDLTAATGVDALSHAIDTVMNRSANPLNIALALGGIELIAKYLRRATFNGQDLEARYYMAMGSTMPMISGAGTLYSHSIAYALAMFQPLAHGIGCSVALPYTMAFNLSAVEDNLALIARAMGERIESISAREAGRRAVECVYDLLVDLKLPVSLKEMGFNKEDLPEMAEICVARYPKGNNPRPMSGRESLTLFKSMWEGKIIF
jgi:alcohol dehydrogenase